VKQRRVERVERRRALVELNLVADAKTRSARGPRGCGSLFGGILIDVAILVLAMLGLS